MSDTTDQQVHVYDKKDYVDVVDAAGDAIDGLPSVPKAWLGTYLVPAGTKKGRPKTEETAGAAPAPRSTRQSGVEPPRNGAGSSLAEWQAYAREKDGDNVDLLDDTGEELTRDALIEKYGTAA